MYNRISPEEAVAAFKKFGVQPCSSYYVYNEGPNPNSIAACAIGVLAMEAAEQQGMPDLINERNPLDILGYSVFKSRTASYCYLRGFNAGFANNHRNDVFADLASHREDYEFGFEDGQATRRAVETHIGPVNDDVPGGIPVSS